LENIDTEVDDNKDWETIRISTFLPKEVYVIMNRSRINHGSMKDAQNNCTKGNKPNCSGYMFQVK
jgi:hypothetical protein